MNLDRWFAYTAVRMRDRTRSSLATTTLVLAGIMMIYSIVLVVPGIEAVRYHAWGVLSIAQIILAISIPLQVLFVSRTERLSGRLSQMGTSNLSGGQVMTGLVFGAPVLSWMLTLVCSALLIAMEGFKLIDVASQTVTLGGTFALAALAVVIQAPRQLSLWGHSFILFLLWGCTAYLTIAFTGQAFQYEQLSPVTATALSAVLLGMIFWRRAGLLIVRGPPAWIDQCLHFCGPLVGVLLHAMSGTPQSIVYPMITAYFTSMVLLITAYWERLSQAESRIGTVTLALRSVCSLALACVFCLGLGQHWDPSVKVNPVECGTLISLVVTTTVQPWLLILGLMLLERRFLQWQSVIATAILVSCFFAPIFLRTGSFARSARIVAMPLVSWLWLDDNNGFQKLHLEIATACAATVLIAAVLAYCVWYRNRASCQQPLTAGSRRSTFVNDVRQSASLLIIDPVAEILGRISPFTEVQVRRSIRKSASANLLASIVFTVIATPFIWHIVNEGTSEAKDSRLAFWGLCSFTVMLLGGAACWSVFFRVKEDRDRDALLRLRNSVLPVWQIAAGYLIGSGIGFLLPAIFLAVVATRTVASLGLWTASLAHFVMLGLAVSVYFVLIASGPVNRFYKPAISRRPRRLLTVGLLFIAILVYTSAFLVVVQMALDLIAQTPLFLTQTNADVAGSEWLFPVEIIPDSSTLLSIASASRGYQHLEFRAFLMITAAVCAGWNLYLSISRIDGPSAEHSSNRFTKVVKLGESCVPILLVIVIQGLLTPFHAGTRQSCLGVLTLGTLMLYPAAQWSLFPDYRWDDSPSRELLIRDGVFAAIGTIGGLGIVFLGHATAGSPGSVVGWILVIALIVAFVFRTWSFIQTLRAFPAIPPHPASIFSIAMVLMASAFSLRPEGPVQEWIKTGDLSSGLIFISDSSLLAALSCVFVEADSIPVLASSVSFWEGFCAYWATSVFLFALGTHLQRRHAVLSLGCPSEPSGRQWKSEQISMR